MRLYNWIGTLLFCFSISLAYSQATHIEVVGITSNFTANNSNEKTIKFPVFVSKDPRLDSTINSAIRQSILDSTIKDDELELWLLEESNNGLSFLEHTITYHDKAFLSLVIFREWCSAYCTHSSIASNFDLALATSMQLEELFQKQGVTEFKAMITADKRSQIESHVAQLWDLVAQHEIDSSECTTVIEFMSLDSDTELDNFSISPSHLSVYDDVEVPHYIRSLGPFIKLEYTWDELEAWLAPEFKSKIKKQ